MFVPIGPVETEPKVVYESMGRRSWRWVLSLSRWDVAIDKQLRDANDPASRWRPIRTWLSVSLRRRVRWGSWHGYYDGPHCAFGLGWLHFYWEGGLISGRCKECEGEDA